MFRSGVAHREESLVRGAVHPHRLHKGWSGSRVPVLHLVRMSVAGGPPITEELKRAGTPRRRAARVGLVSANQALGPTITSLCHQT
jgi:hypothetical protein